jgi:hypothetical protein
MKPNELSSVLRRIASAIENSNSPSRDLVARDLRNVLSRLATPALTKHDSHHMVENLKKNTTYLKDKIKSFEQGESTQGQSEDLKNKLRVISDTLETLGIIYKKEINKTDVTNAKTIINDISDMVRDVGLPVGHIYHGLNTVDKYLKPIFKLVDAHRESHPADSTDEQPHWVKPH